MAENTSTEHCQNCDQEHSDWTKEGTCVVQSKHHRGMSTQYRCGNCGEVTEVLRP